MMNTIARWTTPLIAYRPSMAQIEDITQIKCVLSQVGVDLIVKSLEDCTIEDNRFVWALAQQESAMLASNRDTWLQFDYVTSSGARYTTLPVKYTTVDSGTNEAM